MFVFETITEYNLVMICTAEYPMSIILSNVLMSSSNPESVMTAITLSTTPSGTTF